jgi:hypothetical protein
MFWGDIQEALDNGAKLRVLLADPHSVVVEMASFRSESRLTSDIERKRILWEHRILETSGWPAPDGEHSVEGELVSGSLLHHRSKVRRSRGKGVLPR